MSGTLVSPWIALPAALATMALLSLHMTALSRSDTPASRKRIRIANGWVMLLGIPLLAAGVSVISSDSQPRAFVLVWLATLGLLVISVLLAILDAANTLRLGLEHRLELVEDWEAMRDEVRRRRAEGGGERR